MDNCVVIVGGGILRGINGNGKNTIKMNFKKKIGRMVIADKNK